MLNRQDHQLLWISGQEC